MVAFRKAHPQQAFLKLGIYGASGSGKTFTSLLIAEGLAKLTGKRVAYIDSERGTDFYAQNVKERSVHPESFDFDALYSRSITEALEASQTVDGQYGVLVIDSITHLWEAAKNAYSGKLTSIDTIPFTAWGKIKKPYKTLMNNVISSNYHVIICGRQGNDFSEDAETGELKSIGYKMKAESETPYEPHILIRMEAVKMKGQQSVPTALVEKDRTGILQGKSIPFPNFDTLIKPLLGVLGKEQATIDADDVVAEKDSNTLTTQDISKKSESGDLLKELSAKCTLAKDVKELNVIGKEIQTFKKKMIAEDVASLREVYLDKESKLKGGK